MVVEPVRADVETVREVIQVQVADPAADNIFHLHLLQLLPLVRRSGDCAGAEHGDNEMILIYFSYFFYFCGIPLILRPFNQRIKW